MTISQSYKDFKRLNNIINVLIKYELGWFVHEMKIHVPFTAKRKITSKNAYADLPVKLRKSMEELGGTFIKLGQLLSIRPDLLPKNFIEELSNLQENVAPTPFEEIKPVLEAELKMPLNEAFTSFDKSPIASGSIGQVYKAKLKDGTIVAVKVQHPNIKEVFETDIDLLYHIAKLLEAHIPASKQFGPVKIVEEFEHYTKNELDYVVEAKNLEIFYNNFKNDKYIVIPKVFWKLSSTKVLTMQFISGKKINDIKSFNTLKSSRKVILNRLVNALTLQIVKFGFFHADPHPGNILILANNRISFLDLGIVGSINKELQKKVEVMFIALVDGDKDGFANSLIEIGIADSTVNFNMFKQDLSNYLGKYHNIHLQQFNGVDFLYNVLELAKKHNLILPVDFVLIIKAIVTTEGVGKLIDPSFNFIEASKPLVDQLKATHSTPEYILKSLQRKLISISRVLSSLPEDTKQTLRYLREGKIVVTIKDTKLEELGVELDRSSNRVTFGILIAAFVVGSALVILADLPPKLNGIPILSIVLLILAALTLLFLVISVVKEKEAIK
ncbi:MAG: AarF/ABC1/UbiB kinase family protein [Nanoarchaeota archaeon]